MPWQLKDDIFAIVTGEYNKAELTVQVQVEGLVSILGKVRFSSSSSSSFSFSFSFSVSVSPLRLRLSVSPSLRLSVSPSLCLSVSPSLHKSQTDTLVCGKVMSPHVEEDEE
eukprot:SAG11_NODE_626_length_8100_cov_5.500875_8_plen_111_part_00